MGTQSTWEHLKQLLKMIKISLVLLFAACYCNAKPSQVGIPPHGTPLTIPDASCPDVTGSTNFDAVAYMGRWYQIAAAPFFWSNPKDTCTWANYTLLDDGSVKVVNSEIQWWSGQRFTSTGSAVVNPNQPGTLSVAFGPITPDPEGENYIILNTDNLLSRLPCYLLWWGWRRYHLASQGRR